MENEESRKNLEILEIFKKRIMHVKRDNYNVIKVQIFSDLPEFAEEYKKIIDWRNKCDEQ